MHKIAGSLELNSVMESLARHRPAFHSEADLQFALAQTVQATMFYASSRNSPPFTSETSPRR